VNGTPGSNRWAIGGTEIQGLWFCNMVVKGEENQDRADAEGNKVFEDARKP
jgi:hypothetical protein